MIERVIEKRLTQREAARMLGLTSRQVRRLRRAYERDGPVGLASKHRGRPSNRRLRSELEHEALALVRSQYEDFGPTLAHEKLTELHGLNPFDDVHDRVPPQVPPPRREGLFSAPLVSKKALSFSSLPLRAPVAQRIERRFPKP